MKPRQFYELGYRKGDKYTSDGDEYTIIDPFDNIVTKEDVIKIGAQVCELTPELEEMFYRRVGPPVAPPVPPVECVNTVYGLPVLNVENVGGVYITRESHDVCGDNIIYRVDVEDTTYDPVYILTDV